MRQWFRHAFLLLLLSAFIRVACAYATVDKIRKAHSVICGIDQNEAEYSTTDDHGARVDFDRDLCKAVAGAVLGRNANVIVKGYPDDQAGITNVTGLSDKKICHLAETEVEVMLRTWFENHHLLFVPFPFQEEGEMEAAYVTGNCTGLVGDLTRLAQTRTEFGARAKDYLLLPDAISKDPFALVYRASDTQWGEILEWTVNALIQAEESGVTAGNAESLRASRDPAIERLLGTTTRVRWSVRSRS